MVETGEKQNLSEEMILNMGPQHPATHGVLRVIMTLEGERIIKAEPVVGYLHRGKEKHAESLTYQQYVTFTDRLDYVSSMANNTGYFLTVEKLMGIETTPRCDALRVIICELTRIASHLIWIGCSALDLGAGTVFFHAFRERETLYDLFDSFSGLRMNNGFMRLGGMAGDLSKDTLKRIGEFVDKFPTCVDEYELLLSNNRIFIDRTRDIGKIDAETAVGLGLTGPNLRGSGIPFDLRKDAPYCGYENYDFEIAVGTIGDCYDRYMVRLEEMRQANRIVQQALASLPEGPVFPDQYRKLILPPKSKVYTKMEELIHQFKIVTGLRPPEGEVYMGTEVPKGELGFYILSRGETSPYRLRIRSPSFTNLQALPHMAEGALFSDMTAIIGALDFVMGEVDR
ncbi:MAG: NADH dehydrogenase (quinone) subunit D [Planctomycetes bacterium]|nr:NADH dehydrogenase (quinone) subunit D [Planctomycetota bacterium]